MDEIVNVYSESYPEERNRAHTILSEVDKPNANKYKAILDQTLGNVPMIQSLYIRNYLLIDHLELDFSSGFITITGETGAGKSILMGALSLILGQRVDTSVLKLKDAKCIVEGTFLPGESLPKGF